MAGSIFKDIMRMNADSEVLAAQVCRAQEENCGFG